MTSEEPPGRGTAGRFSYTPRIDAAAITSRIEGSVRSIGALRDRADDIAAAGGTVLKALSGGRTLYTAGNGGSAAQALHLAEELIGRYRGNRPPQRAVCLNADPTALTCIANDFGYDEVFARPCEALLTEGDVLVILTTSGNSANLVRALEVARDRGAVTIGLLGGNGGRCARLCDHAVLVEETDSAFVQDAHQVIVHLLCEIVERASATRPG